MNKFILMGLPGTGKSTTFKKCIELLKSRGIDCNYVSADALVDSRLNRDDEIVQSYQKEKNFIISNEVFDAPIEKRFQIFKEKHGESIFRELQERILIEIIQSLSHQDYLDLNSVSATKQSIMLAAQEKKLIPIFLYADHTTVLDHLEKNGAYLERPAYKEAAEKSLDNRGWMNVSEQHRKQRLPIFSENAVIVISVEKKPEDLLPNQKKQLDKEREQLRDELEQKLNRKLESHEMIEIQKTPDEIVHEILNRIKELELVESISQTNFSRHAMKFFEKEKDSGSSSIQKSETSEEVKKSVKK